MGGVEVYARVWWFKQPITREMEEAEEPKKQLYVEVGIVGVH